MAKSGHSDHHLSCGVTNCLFAVHSDSISALRVHNGRKKSTILTLRSSSLLARQCSVAYWPEQRLQARSPVVRDVRLIRGVWSASTELREAADPLYGTGVVETGTAERDEEERSGFRDFTVTVSMGDSGRGLLLAI